MREMDLLGASASGIVKSPARWAYSPLIPIKKFVCVWLLSLLVFLPAFGQADEDDGYDAEESGYTLKDAAKEAWGLYKQYKRLTGEIETYWEAEIKEGLANGTYIQSTNNANYRRIKKVFDTLLKSDYVKGKYNWRIYLQNANTVNASCAVNGIIIINSGIVNYCKNDDELAIVIGHEMGHMTRNHVRKAVRADVVKDFAVERIAEYIAKKKNKRAGLAEISDKEISDKEMFKVIFGLAGDVALLKYSRRQEQNADEDGAKYAASTGYNSTAGYDLWTRMAKDFGSPVFTFLSTHPASEKRAKHFLEEDYQRKYGRVRGRD